MAEAGQFRTPFDVQCFDLKAAMPRIGAVPLPDPWALRKRHVVSRELATRPQYVRDLVGALRDAASAPD